MNYSKMKFKPLIALSVIALVVLTTYISGCHKKDEICTASVEGVLTDSLTGEPVAGVEVILNSKDGPSIFGLPIELGRDTTDANGEYSIQNTVDCSDDPVVFHTGSQKYEAHFGRKPVDKDRYNKVDFKLRLRPQ